MKQVSKRSMAIDSPSGGGRPHVQTSRVGMPRYFDKNQTMHGVDDETDPRAMTQIFVAGLLKPTLCSSDDPMEREAESFANRVRSGRWQTGAHVPRFMRVQSPRPVIRRSQVASGGMATQGAGSSNATPANGLSKNTTGIAAPVHERLAEQGLGVKAFTVGGDIWWGRGQYADDVGLMAHEVAHVMQQEDGAPPVIRRYDDDAAGVCRTDSATDISTGSSNETHQQIIRSISKIRLKLATVQFRPDPPGHTAFHAWRPGGRTVRPSGPVQSRR